VARRAPLAARRAPLAVRPCARTELGNAPAISGGVVLTLLARGAVRTRSGYTGVRREWCILSLRPAVGCSLVAPPALAAPGRGSMRAWRGVPR
jgi:hypothetical protein